MRRVVVMFDDSLHDAAAQASFGQRVVSYVGYLALWAVYTITTFWLIFQIEEIVVVGAMRLRLNPWQVRAVDKFSLVLIGLAWLVGMLVVEAYLRNGVATRQLLRRAGKVSVGLVIGTLLVVGVNLMI